MWIKYQDKIWNSACLHTIQAIHLRLMLTAADGQTDALPFASEAEVRHAMDSITFGLQDGHRDAFCDISPKAP